jgi:hypothetical protein
VFRVWCQWLVSFNACVFVHEKSTISRARSRANELELTAAEAAAPSYEEFAPPGKSLQLDNEARKMQGGEEDRIKIEGLCAPLRTTCKCHCRKHFKQIFSSPKPV